jgi:hypothetical protein
MKNLIVIFIAGMLLSACSNSGNKTQSVDPVAQNEIVITNDLENAKGVIPSWFNENTVISMTEPPAHSGEFASLTNDTIPYSYAYKEIFKNIDSRIPKLVTCSGWIYTTVANPNFSIICSVDENQQLYNWKSYPLEKDLTEVGKWVEFTTSFNFDDKPAKPEQLIGLYAWNQSKKPVYVDDLKITFTY